MKNNIKKLRVKLGWTQAKMAKELGVSIMTISRWENHKFQPSPLARAKLRELQ